MAVQAQAETFVIRGRVDVEPKPDKDLPDGIDIERARRAKVDNVLVVLEGNSSDVERCLVEKMTSLVPEGAEVEADLSFDGQTPEFAVAVRVSRGGEGRISRKALARALPETIEKGMLEFINEVATKVGAWQATVSAQSAGKAKRRLAQSTRDSGSSAGLGMAWAVGGLIVIAGLAFAYWRG